MNRQSALRPAWKFAAKTSFSLSDWNDSSGTALAICKKTYSANVAMVVNNDVPLSRRYRTRAEECRRIAGSLHGAETQLKLPHLNFSKRTNWNGSLVRFRG
jgi:hypothetical protein